MFSLKQYFQLVRWPNLLILIAIQLMAFYFILEPLLKKECIIPIFSPFLLLLLIFSTVLIAAGGYIINDFMDIQSDKVNRPKKMVITQQISNKSFIFLYAKHTFLGISLGIWAAFKVGDFTLSGIFIMVAILLWLYSSKYKGIPIVGNLIVSFLAGFVIILIWIFLVFALAKSNQTIFEQWGMMKILIFGYSGFAFITTFFREIIKDLEDIEGDRSALINTFPVKYGIKNAKILTIAVILFSVVMIILWSNLLIQKGYTVAAYGFYVVIALHIVLMIKVFFSKSTESFSFSSLLSKIIMIAGILTIPLLLLND